MSKDLILRPESLPESPQELQKLILKGEALLVIQRERIKLAKKAEMASEIYNQELGRGQDIAKLVLEAGIALGKMLKETEFPKGGRGKTYTPGRIGLKDLGLSLNQSSQFQQLSRHAKIVIAEAEKIISKQEIPTRTPILKIIKKSERAEESKKQVEIIKNLKPVKGKFNVIVIDPPWPYGTEYNPDGRRVASPYPEMNIEEIEAIEIPSTEDCILWLWTTNAFMHEAYHILEAWEFEPKTILTWDKEKMGIGVWLRGQTEHCILATKGKPKINLTNQTTIIQAKAAKHSEKPDEFYKMIEIFCLGQQRLDYFARRRREGWEPFGTIK